MSVCSSAYVLPSALYSAIVWVLEELLKNFAKDNAFKSTPIEPLLERPEILL